MSFITERNVMANIGRPRAFDRGAALEAAMVLFWRKGFAATSMNDLCDAMNVRSPSLYAAFGSKEALYLEAVEHYVLTVGPPIWGKLAEGATARAGVESLLLTATETLPESRVTIPAGCMATLAAISDEWPEGIAEARQENPGGHAGHAAVAAGSGRRRWRAASDDGHRRPRADFISASTRGWPSRPATALRPRN